MLIPDIAPGQCSQLWAVLGSEEALRQRELYFQVPWAGPAQGRTAQEERPVILLAEWDFLFLALLQPC